MTDKPSLLAELKRRNVLRAAMLYVGAAWALSQGVAQLLPVFDFPNWVVRWFVIAAAIGFPFAMAFSWFYEWTPHGIQRESEVKPGESITRETGRKLDHAIIAVLGIAVILLLADILVPHRDAPTAASATRDPATRPAAATAPLPIAGNAIAVLAFDDLSPAHDQSDFSEGMAEEILNALTRIKSLKVIARSSSFQFKGRQVSPQEIGAQLGVAHILQGSVRKQGDTLRITATLVQTSDGVQQWSNTYNGKLADVFDLQDSCARDIATQLKAVLGDNGRQRLVDRSTDNAEAYALFVEAQTLVAARVGDNLPRAIVLLRKATTLDPKFARAWSKLAVAYAVVTQYVGGDWHANWSASDHAAKTALELDPDAAEAYAVLSYNHFSQRHYVDMVEPMARALQLDPGDTTATYWSVNELASTGRTAEAEARIDAALVNDPANVLLLFYKSMMRARAGDVAGALAATRRAEARGPAFAALEQAWNEAETGHFDAGAKHFSFALSAYGSKLSIADLEAVYRGTYQGEPQRRAALAILDAHPGDDWTPTFLLQVEEYERSFASFEHGGTGLSDGYLNWLWQREAWSRKARQSPGFQGFARRIGLVDYWKKNRWPDLCSPTPGKGPDAFACR